MSRHAALPERLQHVGAAQEADHWSRVSADWVAIWHDSARARQRGVGQLEPIAELCPQLVRQISRIDAFLVQLPPRPYVRTRPVAGTQIMIDLKA